MSSPTQPDLRLSGRTWWLACLLVLGLALAATVPTTGDIGLTWDEPSYRYSQVMSGQWWEQVAKARSWADLTPLMESNTLLYYWPYGRFGINFHPPLAGQLNLLTHAVFGSWVKDIPSRRLSSVFEYALTITLVFGFLARRYGAWTGAIAAGSILLMPRLYGDGHIAGTDTPGLPLWIATAFAFWDGLNEPKARRWRVLVGILLGLAFVEKMAAVMVVIPLLGWLALTRARGLKDRSSWVDGAFTLGLMGLPLALAFAEILRLRKLFNEPQMTNLFTEHPATFLPGGVLAIPLVVWFVRRLLARIKPASPVWGVERPGLEMLAAWMAFAPVVGWLGNPAWWRETLPRLAHYYAISTARRGVLPDIQILYFGQTYEYSLPWHNAWTLIAITVPAGILVASIVGLCVALPWTWTRKDLIPAYLLGHLLALPVMRMLPTPAHDGVRLFLPTFAFLAIFAGWGAVSVMGRVGRRLGGLASPLFRIALTTLILAPAAYQLIRIHPYELSYFNEFIGGPRGAWNAGFELSYWYDAFNDETIPEINKVVPDGEGIDTLNDKTQPPTFTCLQELGQLKQGLIVGSPHRDRFPWGWILTQDSKAAAFTRLLFVMKPVYEHRPKQLDGLRVVTVDSSDTVSRAWALQLLADAPAPNLVNEPPLSPAWVRSSPLTSWMARLWGDGVTKSKPLTINQAIFDWAARDPAGLRAAAAEVATDRPPIPGTDAAKLRAILERFRSPRNDPTASLLRARPQGLLEAVDILIARPDAVKTVLLRYPYTDPSAIGGFLDR